MRFNIFFDPVCMPFCVIQTLDGLVVTSNFKSSECYHPMRQLQFNSINYFPIVNLSISLERVLIIVM